MALLGTLWNFKEVEPTKGLGVGIQPWSGLWGVRPLPVFASQSWVKRLALLCFLTTSCGLVSSPGPWSQSAVNCALQVLKQLFAIHGSQVVFVTLVGGEPPLSGGMWVGKWDLWTWPVQECLCPEELQASHRASAKSVAYGDMSHGHCIEET